MIKRFICYVSGNLCARNCFIALSIFISSLSNLNSQNNNSEELNTNLPSSQSRLLSAGICFGVSTLGFPMLNGSIAFHKNRNIYSLRYVSASERIETLTLYSHSEPLEKISEIAFCFGKEKKFTHRFAGFIGGGVSYLQGMKRGRYLRTESGLFGDVRYYEEKEFKTVGLVIDGKIIFLMSKYFNLNLNGFADFNFYKIYGGVGLGLNFSLPI